MKPVSARQSAVGSRGSRARWPDLIQTLQPSRPAVARSVAPASSLNHESRVNSSPPSTKLPSRTSNSIPQGIGTAMLMPASHVRRDKAALFPVGARPTRRFAPAGSNRGRHGGDECLKPRIAVTNLVTGRVCRPQCGLNAEQTSKKDDVQADPKVE